MCCMVAIVEEHRGPMGLVIERGYGFESHPIAYYVAWLSGKNVGL